jgi:cystine transport system permease protein
LDPQDLLTLLALLREAAPGMLKGAGYTLVFALAAMAGGLVLGFPAAHYVSVFRNTLISLIKDTSLVSVITMTELMLVTKELISVTFRPLP